MAQTLKEKVTAHLKETVGLGDSDVAELLALGQGVVAQALKDFPALLQAADLLALAEAAHALKGNLLNMGLDDLAELAKAIEAGAKTGDLDLVRVNVEGLESALAQF